MKGNEMLEKILAFAEKIVMKYGTKSLVASLAMWFNYVLAMKVPPSPTVITAMICITVIAIFFFLFKHIQEINETPK